MIKAVILAGGYGTRISEESHLRPKPMIEIVQEFYDGAHKDKIRSVIAESRETRARL